jgi:ABC-2 type transport system permease protein
VFEGMRAIIAGGAPSGNALLWGLGLCALYILLAAWVFAWVHREVVRSGLLARYKAESAA